MTETPASFQSSLNRRTMLAAATATSAAALIRSRSTTAAHDEGTPSPVGDDQASYLFVQAGFESGILDQATEGVQSWMLTLQGAPEQTLFFSDEPKRIAGSISTERFLELLDFDGDDAPNAALVIQTDAGTDVVVLELTNPVYDPAAATLTYITRILDADQLERSGYGFVTDPLGPDTYPAEFGPASLFIDSLLGCSPWDPRCG